MNISTEWTEDQWDSFSTWLNGILHENPVTVTFTKKDGTERVMNCTLQPELLPKVELKENTKPRKESNTSMRVFDLDKKEWRSFTIKNVKRIRTVIGEDDDKV
jgi:hypothetical protein